MQTRKTGLLAVAVTVAVLAFGSVGFAQADFAGGLGTHDDPYLVATAEHLNNVRHHLDAHFLQVRHINLGMAPWSEGVGWTPISMFGDFWDWDGEDESTAFNGTYDGNGFVIQNLTVLRAEDWESGALGLFGFVGSSGVIRNVALSRVNVVSGGFNVGSVAGINWGEVSRCYATGFVMSGDHHAGGLVGHNQGAVSECFSACEVYGGVDFGGLAGSNGGTIEDCYVAGNVKTVGDGGGLRGGGIVGWNWDTGVLRRSYISSRITVGSGSFDIGRVFGANYGGVVEDCYWNTDAYAFPSDDEGGRTAAEMRQQATYPGWDFGQVWSINEGVSFPELRNRPGSPFPTGELLANASFNDPNGAQWEIPPEAARHLVFPSPGVADLHVPGFVGTLLWQELDLEGFAGLAFRASMTLAADAYPDPDAQTIAVFLDYEDGSGLVQRLPVFNPFDGTAGALPNGTAYETQFVLPQDASRIVGFSVDKNGPGQFAALDFSLSADGFPILVSTIEQIQGIGRNPDYPLDGFYVQDRDIDASGTQAWDPIAGTDEYYGFNPVGIEHVHSGGFTGVFDGQGHAISELFIHRPGENFVGLFGVAEGQIRNLGLADANVAGHDDTGALVGWLRYGGQVTRCYSTGEVGGNTHVGGLVGGISDAGVFESYSQCGTHGVHEVGGLAGRNEGDIRQTYAAGLVTSSPGSASGGLVGEGSGSVSASFWDIEASGQPGSAGGVGVNTTPEMKTRTTFQAAGWDFVSVWGVKEGATYPYLVEFLRPIYISTIEQLQSIGNDPAYPMDGYYVLAEPLVANGEEAGGAFIPIGGDQETPVPFTGRFDGQGNTISGLHIALQFHPSSSHVAVGLFRVLADGAVVTNLGLLGGSAHGNTHVGALAGRLEDGIVAKCYADVPVQGIEAVGGLLGMNRGEAIECFAAGQVTGNLRPGGLVGANEGLLENCYSVASVEGGENAGGLVGWNLDVNGYRGRIAKCYAAGPVSGASAGGLLAVNHGDVEDSFWDMDASGQSGSAGGQGKASAEMIDGAMFADAGWDMMNVWAIVDAASYPYLRANPQPQFPDARVIEEVSVFWGSHYQRGPAGEPVLVGHRFSVEIDAIRPLQSTRFQSPANPGQWIDLAADGEQWEFEHVAETMAELDALFPGGEYAIEAVPLGGGDPFAMTVEVPGAADMPLPASIPRVLSPDYGQSDAGETTVEVRWQAVASPDFQAIVFGLEEVHGGEIADRWFDDLGTSAHTIEGLQPNRVYEGWLVFGNLHQDDEREDGVEVLAARFTESLLLFGTNTDANRFANLEAMRLLHPEMADGGKSLVFEADFGGAFDFQAAELWTPTRRGFGLAMHGWGGNILRHVVSGEDAEAWLHVRDGWYALIMEYAGGEAAVTPIWFGNPGSDDPLAMPQQTPAFLAPGAGQSVPSPVAFEWEPVTDQDVNLIQLELGKYGTDPALAEFLAPDATEFGPEALDPAKYDAFLFFQNIAQAGAAETPDGVVWVVAKAAGGNREFYVAPADGNAFLWFSQGPQNAVAGQMLGAVRVEIRDEDGRLLSDRDDLVTLSVLEGPGGLTGAHQVNAVAGIAAFHDVALEVAGDGYRLRATLDGFKDAESDPFDIAPAAAAGVAFTAQPAGPYAAGAEINAVPQVTIQDPYGNTVDTDAEVTIALGENPGGGALSGTLARSAVNGVATFAGLSIDKAGVGYTLKATSDGFETESDPFDIQPAAASRLAFTAQPVGPYAAGQEINAATPAVAIMDEFDNIVDSEAEVSVSLGQNPSQGTLSGVLARNAVNGVAAFADLSIDKAGAGYTLKATAGNLEAESAAFDIEPAAADRLEFAVSPGATPAGQALAPAPVVHVLDEFGNLVVASSAQVALAIDAESPPGGVLAGDNPVAAENGVATFANLRIEDAAGEGFKLQATSGDLLAATSQAFEVTAEPALRISKAADRDPAEYRADETVAFTITYGNRGLAPAENVVIEERIPGGAVYVQGSATRDGEFIPATNRIVWELGELAAGEDGLTVEFQVTFDSSMPQGGTIANTDYFIVCDGVEPEIGPEVRVTVLDTQPPSASLLVPSSERLGLAPRDTLVVVEVSDAGSGVEPASVRIEINGDLVYDGSEGDVFDSTGEDQAVKGVCRRVAADPANPDAAYRFRFVRDEDYAFAETCEVRVEASDLAGNSMDDTFGFATAPRPFGAEFRVNDTRGGVAGRPALASDGDGNLFAAWAQNGRVRWSKRPAGARRWTDSVRASNTGNPQSAPAIAGFNADGEEIVVVAFEDRRDGRDAVLVAVWVDGEFDDGLSNYLSPLESQAKAPSVAYAEDADRLYFAWQERETEEDTWGIVVFEVDVAGEDDDEAHHLQDPAADQTRPALATDGTEAYVVWTHDRGDGTTDLRGASSGDGWQMVDVLVDPASSQSRPSLAVEPPPAGPFGPLVAPAGPVFHLAWEDDRDGAPGVYYGSGNALTLDRDGILNVVADEEDRPAAQRAPSVQAAGGRVFVVWQDDRHANEDAPGDVDVFFAEKEAGDDAFGMDTLLKASRASQAFPALATGPGGVPVVIWLDTLDGESNVKGAGAVGLPEVGRVPATPGDGADMPSVAPDPNVPGDRGRPGFSVPPNAVDAPVDIVVREVLNPPDPPRRGIGVPWDFGPSGQEFDPPVTIEIPVTPEDMAGRSAPYRVFWYDETRAAMGEDPWRDDGIAGVRYSEEAGVIEFTTTHFTLFGAAGSAPDAPARRSNGNGCAMTGSGPGDPSLLWLPLAFLALLVWRDSRRRRTEG